MKRRWQSPQEHDVIEVAVHRIPHAEQGGEETPHLLLTSMDCTHLPIAQDSIVAKNRPGEIQLGVSTHVGTHKQDCSVAQSKRTDDPLRCHFLWRRTTQSGIRGDFRQFPKAERDREENGLFGQCEEAGGEERYGDQEGVHAHHQVGAAVRLSIVQVELLQTDGGFEELLEQHGRYSRDSTEQHILFVLGRSSMTVRFFCC